jgi:hypothetical protein
MGEQCFILKTLLILMASVDPFISHKTIHVSQLFELINSTVETRGILHLPAYKGILV